MKQELKYIIPPIVLLALIFVLASDYCRPIPNPASDLVTYLEASNPFNPFCYVKGFDPEAPEFQTSSPVPANNSAYYVTASGTATTMTASPSLEIPET